MLHVLDPHDQESPDIVANTNPDVLYWRRVRYNPKFPMYLLHWRGKTLHPADGVPAGTWLDEHFVITNPHALLNTMNEAMQGQANGMTEKVIMEVMRIYARPDRREVKTLSMADVQKDLAWFQAYQAEQAAAAYAAMSPEERELIARERQAVAEALVAAQAAAQAAPENIPAPRGIAEVMARMEAAAGDSALMAEAKAKLIEAAGAPPAMPGDPALPQES